MSYAHSIAAPRPAPRGGWRPGLRPGLDDPRRRNLAMLVFYVSAISVAMSISQEATPETGSLIYWMLLLPAIVLPFTNPFALARSAGSTGLLPVAMAFIGGLWHVAQGDTTAAMQIGLMGLSLAWLASPSVSINVRDLTRLYLAMFGVGTIIWLVSDYNQWGLIPGTTSEAYGIWRVSFFPNIANTAFFSLAIILLLTRARIADVWKSPIFLIAAYFVVFSFVRSALIGLLLYFILRWYFRRSNSSMTLFWVSLLTAILVNVVIVYSPVLFANLQGNSLISRLFLRGETGISTDEIYQQLYRPWLWRQHFNQFFTSPWMMGWGSIDFNLLKTDDLIQGQEQGGTVSLPTRLLAVYGLPGLLFTVFLLVQLYRLARVRDTWACAAFPAIFLTMMQWGSIFHPSDALGAIYIMIAIRGSQAFSFTQPALPMLVPAQYQRFLPVAPQKS